MSWGRLLGGLRDVTSSEKIIKINCLLEKILTFNVKVENPNGDEAISGLLSHTCIVSCSRGHLSL